MTHTDENPDASAAVARATTSSNIASSGTP
jgi:hypothetical protein